jgi:hypothetical protein
MRPLLVVLKVKCSFKSSRQNSDKGRKNVRQQILVVDIDGHLYFLRYLTMCLKTISRKFIQRRVVFFDLEVD